MNKKVQLSSKQLYTYKQLLYNNDKKKIVYGGGAGSGKTVLLCYWIITMALQYAETRYVIGRSQLVNLKRTTLNSLIGILNSLEIEYKINNQDNYIKFENGSLIYLKDLQYRPNQDPNYESLGGLEITAAAVDELTEIPEIGWNILFSRIRFKLDEYGLVPKILGTCNPSKNWVKFEYYDKHLEHNLEPDRLFVNALVTDNPFISKHYINSLASLDSMNKERLLLGNWNYEHVDNALFDSEKLISIFNSETKVESDNTYYLSIDVASGKGRDYSVIVLWKGYEIIDLHYTNSEDLVVFSHAIFEYVKTYNIYRKNIIVDQDGIGHGVFDILKKQLGSVINFNANGKLLGGKKQNYRNLKTELFFKCANTPFKYSIHSDMKINNINIKTYINQELSSIRIVHKDDAKININSKDEQKLILNRSPDFADAIMMRFYFSFKSGIMV